MSKPLPALSFSGGTLVLEGMDRDEVRLAFPSTPWVWDPRVAAWRCDARQYASVVKQFAETGKGDRSNLPRPASGWCPPATNLRSVPGSAQIGPAPFADRVPGWEPIRWPQVKIHPLRPEQQAAVEAWTAARQGIVVMPTGTGKTEVALSIMARTAVATLVVAPVRDLMYQWHRRILAGLGYDAGIIGDNVFRVRPVSVTTYDSACIHTEQLGNRFGLLVFDECHHLPGPALARRRPDERRHHAAGADRHARSGPTGVTPT